MKTFKYNFRILVALLTFILPWASTEAVENFRKAGVITSVGYDQFTIYDQKFRFAPGARISSNDDTRQIFSDFRTGDEIYFEGVILNGVFYVNIIYYETPVPS